MVIGPPILFENMLIRKMLDLAKIKKCDTFYDLGCGHAQNLIIAAKEYGVRDCIGIDLSYSRCREARRIIDRLGLSDRITIVNRNFQDVDLSNADVVFYGLSPDQKLLDKFMNNLKPGCRLIYYTIWPLPPIKPDKIDYPFYTSKAPVKLAKTEKEWLSSMIPGKNPTIDEYWQEIAPSLGSKYDIGFFYSGDSNHRRDLKRLLYRNI